MATKECFTLSDLQNREPHHRIQFNVISRTSLICKDGWEWHSSVGDRVTYRAYGCFELKTFSKKT